MCVLGVWHGTHMYESSFMAALSRYKPRSWRRQSRAEYVRGSGSMTRVLTVLTPPVELMLCRT